MKRTVFVLTVVLLVGLMLGTAGVVSAKGPKDKGAKVRNSRAAVPHHVQVEPLATAGVASAKGPQANLPKAKGPEAKNPRAAVRYYGETDELAEWLGPIDMLANSAGFHFWFTPTESDGPYLAGHRYHNVYKVRAGDPCGPCDPCDPCDPCEWCRCEVPGRVPYDLSGFAGMEVHYRIIDTMTDQQVCPLCP